MNSHVLLEKAGLSIELDESDGVFFMAMRRGFNAPDRCLRGNRVNTTSGRSVAELGSARGTAELDKADIRKMIGVLLEIVKD